MKPTKYWYGMLNFCLVVISASIAILLTAIVAVISIVLFIPSLGHSWKLIELCCREIFPQGKQESWFDNFMTSLFNNKSEEKT